VLAVLGQWSTAAEKFVLAVLLHKADDIVCKDLTIRCACYNISEDSLRGGSVVGEGPSKSWSE
jgi:hypothetical protein